MVWKDWLTAVGLIVELVGAVYYLWTILKGSTRPQPITWGGWTAIGAVGAWASYSGGAGLGFYIAASFVAVTASVFVVSLIPGYGHKGTDKPEPADLPILIAGIILLILRAMNLFPVSVHASLAVLGDACFAWYTLRKAWRYPETESLLAWAIGVLVAAVGVIVLGSFSYTAAVFPIYILIGNAAITGTLLVRHYKPAKKRAGKA
ncbi:MAG: hypothetical protein ABSD10_02290 [Candidatus Saccharimonadales bacterium]|jgi:hypothetical protein